MGATGCSRWRSTTWSGRWGWRSSGRSSATWGSSWVGARRGASTRSLTCWVGRGSIGDRACCWRWSGWRRTRSRCRDLRAEGFAFDGVGVEGEALFGVGDDGDAEAGAGGDGDVAVAVDGDLIVDQLVEEWAV